MAQRRQGRRPPGGQLNPDLIHSYALADQPPPTASGQLAWRLGQGRTIGAKDRTEVGARPSTVTATISALRRRGWIIRTTAGSKHDGSESSYVVEQRPASVPAIQVAADVEPAPNGNGNGRRDSNAKRSSDRIELAAYRALHAPAPAAPAVGTVLRATMVAEDSGAAVMALRDRDGSTWFVRVEGGGKS